MVVGDELRAIRVARGWSQARLAEELSAMLGGLADDGFGSRTRISGAAVGKYERGENVPRGDVQLALSRILNSGRNMAEPDPLTGDAARYLGMAHSNSRPRSDWKDYIGKYVVFKRSFDERHLVCARVAIIQFDKNSSEMVFEAHQKSGSGAVYSARGIVLCEERRLTFLGFRDGASILEAMVCPLPEIGVRFDYLHGVASTSTYPGIPYCSKALLRKEVAGVECAFGTFDLQRLQENNMGVPASVIDHIIGDAAALVLKL